MDDAPPLLQVRDLAVEFRSGAATVRAIDGVSFDLARGETLGIVGESGCGKSVTSLSIMRLVPSPPGKMAAGEILFDGSDLLLRSEAEMRRIRGAKISMILQEPMTSLNPVHSVGAQIAEAIGLHENLPRAAIRALALEMLKLVRIPDPELRLDVYPHQMSGGMRQRVMIAMALACNPQILIADEPTTALDVTIQAQILWLLRDLRARTGASIILITHDLGVIAELAQRVVVMYAGRIVEEASVAQIFDDPQHPYTIGLLGSIPKLHVDAARLETVEGSVPSSFTTLQGCRFHPRCPFADDRCRHEDPVLREVAPAHRAACLKAPLALASA